jgi:Domain of unknown function (DUF5615)
MRFLLDESADLPLARSLQDLGHDVTAIVRDYQRGQLDPAVLALALREQRILITNDGDFRALVAERRLPTPASSGCASTTKPWRPSGPGLRWSSRITSMTWPTAVFSR